MYNNSVDNCNNWIYLLDTIHLLIQH